MHVGEFEEILAGEGLAPVDTQETCPLAGVQWPLSLGRTKGRPLGQSLIASGGRFRKPRDGFRHGSGTTLTDVEDAAAAVSDWRAWADQVYATYPFRKQSQRTVWKLYAEGVPMRDIPARRGAGDLREVARTIAHIKAKSPPGPPNPWYRGQPSANAATERTTMIRTLHYSQIACHRPVKVPGAMNTDVFNNVDGTPHVGGIDLEVGKQIILVTWGNVKSATRAAVTE